MKKYRLLLPLAAMAIWLAACSEAPARPGCRIKGNISLEKYKTVFLLNASGIRIDSCEVQDGRFYLEEADNVVNPYVATIHMTAEQDSTDQLFMPVAIENGTVRVGLEEYITLSGTPLNVRVKEFLDAMQHCKDGVGTKAGITDEEIVKVFSEFYKQQILSNKNNAVGQYIYDNYGLHLSTTDREQVKAQMGN